MRVFVYIFSIWKAQQGRLPGLNPVWTTAVSPIAVVSPLWLSGDHWTFPHIQREGMPTLMLLTQRVRANTDNTQRLIQSGGKKVWYIWISFDHVIVGLCFSNVTYLRSWAGVETGVLNRNDGTGMMLTSEVQTTKTYIYIHKVYLTCSPLSKNAIVQRLHVQ